MQTFTISNAGELELNAIMLMGASTKRDDDSKIGMFGTGFKYAIAVLMRIGCSIVIRSGRSTIEFKTKRAVLGGKQFAQVVMLVSESRLKRPRTIPLSFTTEMGPQWTVDNAMREIICNAVDAGSFSISESPLPKAEGMTHITIGGSPTDISPVAKHIHQFDDFYLFNRTPIYKDSIISLYQKRGTGAAVFRHGVRVFYSEELSAAYDYQLNNIYIDERRLAGRWAACSEIGSNLSRLPKEHIEAVLRATGDSNSLEAHVDSFDSGATLIPKPAGNGVYCTQSLAARWNDGEFGKHLFSFSPFIVSDAVYKLLKKTSSARTVHAILGAVADGYSPIEQDDLTSIELSSLTKALAFCKAAGYDVADSVVLYDSDDGAYGVFREGKIWLNRIGLRRGISETVNTIIHETMHMLSGRGDASRGFEEFIIAELVSALQFKVGEAV